MSIKNLKRVWAEIDLDNLTHNIKETKKLIKPDVLIAGVVKADGYGHGAVTICQTLLENSVDRFVVATLSEAIQLRKLYKETPIMIIDYTSDDNVKEIIEYNLIQTVCSYNQTLAFSQRAQEMKMRIKVHVKIDTGMNNLGMKIDEKTIEEIKKIYNLPNIFIEGIFTHFATADEKDKSFTYQQLERFKKVCSTLENNGIKIPIKHVSNSAAIIDLPEANFDMVRPGIMLYGLYPSNEINKSNITLKQVMTLKAKVSQVKKVEAEECIGYGLTHKFSKKSEIAILPLGYAEGFTRLLSGKAEVIIKNKKVPVVGKICMDQCMIDVTGLDVKEDDEVILFGNNDKLGITIDEVAKKLNTINYEMICMVSRRVPRVYKKNNQIVQIKDYVLD